MNLYPLVRSSAGSCPILSEEKSVWLCNFLENHKIDSVLELGCAIGYSGLLFLQYVKKLTTVDINLRDFEIAKKNFDSYGFSPEMHFIDGIDFLNSCTTKFDLIFIDFAKKKSYEAFKLSEKLINFPGYIIIDNVFHEKFPKKLIDHLKKYDTTFFHSGDGISLTRFC